MSHNTPKDRVFELDVLRFSAALAVVLYHLTYRQVEGEYLFTSIDYITRFGYLGVNLFFMISGFVILWTAVGRSPSKFLISRFSRLYPIFWVTIAIVILSSTILNNQTYELSRILANMTMVAGYLNQPYIDSVYWTLQVELKFYVLVFMLLTLKQLGNIDNWLIVWTIGSIASYLIPSIGALTIHPFGPYFIAGATFFLIWKDKVTITRAGILIICMVMSMYETIEHTKDFLFEDTSTYEIISAIIVFSFYILMTAITLGHIKIGESATLFKLAMMTYPIYLLHNIFGKQIYDALDMNRYLSLSLVLIFLFAVSYALALYVDRPLNRTSNRILNNLHDRIVKNEHAPR